MNAKDLVF